MARASSSGRSRTTPKKATARRPAAASKSAGPVVPAFLAPLVRAVSKLPGVTLEKGWGSANVALKVRGEIFAMTMGEDLVLKLPKERVDALVDDGAGTRFDPRKDGRVMKEWLVLHRRTKQDATLVREAQRFVAAGD